ncbi:MAG: sigma 54-interacting transcriptional regulator [Myxococcaceae bacterium]|nr:sigma 54-interacting transcriptional regulator [Myxococcaceae bacterium]
MHTDTTQRDTTTAVPSSTSGFRLASALVTALIEPDRPRVLLGHSRACDVVVADPRVSRRHASLELRDGGLWVKDLDSTNGTWVNGLRLGAAWLSGGERLEVGSTSFTVEREAVSSPAAIPVTTRFGRALGQSEAMRRVFHQAQRLAQSEVPVLIEGETGTGKEVLAESLHEASRRAAGPFVVFDCTTVPAGLLESSLFGHEKGAFTGAVQQHLGVFERAHGGTLFIDEIGDLELASQSRLLRVLERREVQRVGGERPFPVDVRVIAATRRDLEKAIQAGRFRDDLFYRLAVTRLELPPLRERPGDVELLARAFWQQLKGPGELPPAWIERALGAPWPGNVRELRNAIARLIALGLTAPPAPAVATETGELLERIAMRDQPFATAREQVLAEFERRYVHHALLRANGNVSQAARNAGIGRRYFYVLKDKAKG